DDIERENVLIAGFAEALDQAVPDFTIRARDQDDFFAAGGHQRMTPNALPTDSKAASACSRSSCEWAAVFMTRMRAAPLATVGKPIAIAKTPFSNNWRLNACASDASPSITGIIGVSLWPMSKPRFCISRFMNSALSQRRRTSSSELSRISTAAR